MGEDSCDIATQKGVHSGWKPYIRFCILQVGCLSLMQRVFMASSFKMLPLRSSCRRFGWVLSTSQRVSQCCSRRLACSLQWTRKQMSAPQAGLKHVRWPRQCPGREASPLGRDRGSFRALRPVSQMSPHARRPTLPPAYFDTQGLYHQLSKKICALFIAIPPPPSM